jgi:hypothetical protein
MDRVNVRIRGFIEGGSGTNISPDHFVEHVLAERDAGFLAQINKHTAEQ